MFNFIVIFIKTFGCNINNYESEKVYNIFNYFKIIETKKFFFSNILILNTCIIRKNPQIKILKDVKMYFFLKKYKKIIIIITGCMTESDFFYNIKYLKSDIILNNIGLLYIKKFIIFYIKYKKKIFFIKKKKNYFFKLKINNFIQIMSGCNHNCTYCIIPQTKGREKYYLLEDILSNIVNNIKRKYFEITLLGQNVNSYNISYINFNNLLFNISKIKNVKRINFFSSNIYDFDKNFFFLYKNIKKISNHLHLPIQSGSNIILKKMNRKYSINNYIYFIKKIKEIKFTTISTDIIVGFPYENFLEFDKTLKIIKKINFIDIYYFLYSKRKFSISYNFKENKEIIKNFKLFIINKNMKNNIKIYIGKKVRVYVIGYINKNIYIGKLDNLKLVFFEYYSYNIIGNFIIIKIIEIKKNIFLGLYENNIDNF